MSEKRRRSESPEEPPSRPIKPISASKLQAFTVGSQKKTAYQKHREESELKKQQESVEAAKVYAEFVASFEEPTPYKMGTTSFVKSGTLNPNAPSASSSSSSLFKPMPFVKAGESAKKSFQNIQEEEEEEEDAFSKMKESKAGKKRNLDSFLEEIKKGQEDRAKPDYHHQTKTHTTSHESGSGNGGGGSFDDGDPFTTNLYVGNINPTVTETGLCHVFGKYGPIASVKIMWPRTQEEKDKGRNCGFVSFMQRGDADQAIRHLDGKEIEGFAMRVGWGKAVPLPAQPFFVQSKVTTTAKTGLPFNAHITTLSTGVNARPRAEVHVTKPTDLQLMRIIHRVVERVIKHGHAFETALMEREENNPKFKFLFDSTSPEHIYYRWKLYSLLQGDTKLRWMDEPFQMFEGGPWWIPPELPLLIEDENETMFDTDDELAEQDQVSKGTLGQIAKQRLGGLLREVTFQRGTIARTMAFAIDHADAATEIVDVLCRSILIPDSPLSVKLARLYLISDILHNSSVHVSNAWKYRKEFESQLPVVFDHFNQIYRSVNARLKAEQVRKHISAVIGVWENWMIFPKYYTDQLNEIFLKKETKDMEKSIDSAGNDEYNNSTLVDNYPTEKEQSMDGESIEEQVNTTIDNEYEQQEEEEDLDGEVIEEDEDIDGEPMDDNEDVDGEPIDDEDVDGEAIEEQNDSNLPETIDDMFA